MKDTNALGREVLKVAMTELLLSSLQTLNG